MSYNERVGPSSTKYFGIQLRQAKCKGIVGVTDPQSIADCYIWGVPQIIFSCFNTIPDGMLLGYECLNCALNFVPLFNVFNFLR